MSADAEVAALETVSAALADLDRAACDRVLKWAQGRYTRLHILDGDLDAMTRFTETLGEAAQTIGNVTPRDIIRFVDAVRQEQP